MSLQARLSYHHALQSALPDIGASSSQPYFWVGCIPSLGYHVDAVRYGLAALGVAHRVFVSREALDLDPRERSRQECLVVQSYNAAIGHLRTLMTSRAPADPWLVLVCCLVFVCLENLRGRYAEATRHLRAGAQLLMSTLAPDTAAPGPTPPPARHGLAGRVPWADGDWRCDVIAAFSALGLDISSLIDEDVISHLALFGPPALDDSAGGTAPFASLDAAQRELDQIEIAYDTLLERGSRGGATGPDPADPTQPAGWSWRGASRLPVAERDRAAYRGLCRRFRRWSTALNLLADGAGAGGGLPALRLQQTFWASLLLPRVDGDLAPFGAHPADLAAIMDQAEPLIRSGAGGPHPVFALYIGVVSSVAYVGVSTEDASLLRRVVAALRAANRREGVWDSVELAEVFEAMLLAREHHAAELAAFSGSSLEVFGALSSLGLPCISARNCFAIWAREVAAGRAGTGV